jgi:hypothetical protein
VLGENFMRGAKDMLDAMYHPQEYGPQYLRNMATNWIPFSVGMSQVARKIDPYQREAHTIFDAARTKVPGVPQQLFPRRAVFGEPMPQGGNSAYKNDPVVKALENAQMGIGKIPLTIRGFTLTDQQHDDFARIAGGMAKTDLNDIVGMDGFADLPIGMRRELMHKRIEHAREIARDLVMSDSIGTENDIMQKATEASQAYITGGPSAKTAILSSAKR